jgi:glycosyltransferase involved in cell wall biosynthesis
MNEKSGVKKLVIISGSGNTIAWFRLEMLQDFISRSYEVYALAPDISDDSKKLLDDANIQFIKIDLVRKSLNIMDLVKSIYTISLILKEIKPNIIFSYTHKAIIAGSFASFIASKKIISISMISGIGHIFNNKNLKDKVKRFFGLFALKLALKINKIVFFQNIDDKNLFLELALVKSDQARLVNGSGVNLEKFLPSPLPDQPIFLTMARLLKSKGLIEFANAAKLVKESRPDARFLLYGYPDDHEDSISESDIKTNWHDRYGIEYMGFAHDPALAIKACSVFVLLSYNEGTPRSVLEAMSMGRAIITTDARGCRETVINGENGFLVPVGDYKETANRMMQLMESTLRQSMGLKSRDYCEYKFDVKIVNKEIIDVVTNLHFRR